MVARLPGGEVTGYPSVLFTVFTDFNVSSIKTTNDVSWLESVQRKSVRCCSHN